MLCLKVGEGALTSYRGHDPIAASEVALRHQSAETRRRAGNEPGLTHDDAPFRCPAIEQGARDQARSAGAPITVLKDPALLFTPMTSAIIDEELEQLVDISVFLPTG
jgi:hypothetical protein